MEANKPTDTPPERSLTRRSEADVTPPTAGNWLTKTLAFTGEALTDEAERSRGYKLVSYALNLISIVGLAVSTTVGYIGPWQAWFVLAIALLVLSILNAVRNYHERAVRSLEGEREALRGELSDIRAYKLVAVIVHTSSSVYAEEHIAWNCPVIHVQIGLRFKNQTPHDIAIEDFDLAFYERSDDGIEKELPAKNRRQRTLRYRDADGATAVVDIAGLVVKGHSISREYTYLDESMTILDEPHLTPTNGLHFLRLTLWAVVPQKPYVVDIGVDWERPGAYIWSKGPTDD